MEQWDTLLPALYVEVKLGISRDPAHCAFFRPPEDMGHSRSTAFVQLPAKREDVVETTVKTAGEFRGRLACIADTHVEAEAFAVRVIELLPDYVRVPIDQAVSGRWAMWSVAEGNNRRSEL